MSLSELRDEFRGRLADFLWDQWGQMGVSANSREQRDAWAVDPEALLLLTFEVGREESRLFEEVGDWMLVNERLVSVQRLRNLAVDEDDRALVDAVLGWLGENRRRARLGARLRRARTRAHRFDHARKAYGGRTRGRSGLAGASAAGGAAGGSGARFARKALGLN